MKDYLRVERLTGNVSFVIGWDTILPHSPVPTPRNVTVLCSKDLLYRVICSA
jgi:hypothetical protein